MRHATGIGNSLRAATFVFRARDTILGPDLHGNANDVVSLFAQEITRHAGIDSAAHPEQNAFFHDRLKYRMDPICHMPPARAGRLTNSLPRKVNRQGKSFERLMPIRSSATTATRLSVRGNKQCRGPAQMLIS